MSSARKNNRRHKKKKGGGNKEVVVFGRHWKGQVFPPRLRVCSDFTILKQQSNAGQAYYNSRLIPTYLYDVDPALGSTSMPFLTELAGIYRRYRLVKCTAIFSFASRETFPMIVYLVPLNTDPGNNVLSNATFYSNPLCKKIIIGGTAGNNKGRLKTSFTVAQFAGSVDANLDDQYSARTDGTAGGPVQAMTVVFGAASTGADLFGATGGITFTLDLKLEWDAFELTTPPG